MIHNKTLKNFYFIDDFNKDHIRSLNKNISIIYRNYSEKYNADKIFKIKKFCKNIKKKFYLAGDIMLANKLKLDGAYIPAFNNSLSVCKLKNKNMILLGSAHNLKEINQKKRQGVDIIFLAPISPSICIILSFMNLENKIGLPVWSKYVGIKISFLSSGFFFLL